MKSLDKQFEDWVRARHLEDCPQCNNDGKARLMDTDALMVADFRLFYQQRKEAK